MFKFIKSIFCKKTESNVHENTEETYLAYDWKFVDTPINVRSFKINLYFISGDVVTREMSDILNINYNNRDENYYIHQIRYNKDSTVYKYHINEQINNIDIDKLERWEIDPNSMSDIVKLVSLPHRVIKTYIRKYDKDGSHTKVFVKEELVLAKIKLEGV